MINNSGVLKIRDAVTADGFEASFLVNTFIPYALTRELLSIIPRQGRIVNVSSAAQVRVAIEAMYGRRHLGDMAAYAQSKLAITIRSHASAQEMIEGLVVVAVNPGSLHASKLVHFPGTCRRRNWQLDVPGQTAKGRNPRKAYT